MAGDNVRKGYKPIPLDVSVHLRYLHQDAGLSGRELVEKYPEYSPRSIYRHAKKSIGTTLVDKRGQNPGRPKKLNDRDKRHINRTVEHLQDTCEEGTFFSGEVHEVVGCEASNRTVRRSMNSSGYKFTQCRKKGILTEEDMKKRLKFAKTARKYSDEIWQRSISFYLDGSSFVHKTNPSEHCRTFRTRMWRKPSQGLKRQCTAKGSKTGAGGRKANFMVAIAHGKGVIKCWHYEGRINGELFSVCERTFSRNV